MRRRYKMHATHHHHHIYFLTAWIQCIAAIEIVLKQKNNYLFIIDEFRVCPGQFIQYLDYRSFNFVFSALDNSNNFFFLTIHRKRIYIKKITYAYTSVLLDLRRNCLFTWSNSRKTITLKFLLTLFLICIVYFIPTLVFFVIAYGQCLAAPISLAMVVRGVMALGHLKAMQNVLCQ